MPSRIGQTRIHDWGRNPPHSQTLCAQDDKIGIANEHVAYVTLTKDAAYADMSERAKLLSVYALTGFANFSSIGIQLGGIGALAPERRADLAKRGLTALFVGFLATILNASVAGLLIR